MAFPKIISLGFATPSLSYTQQEIFEELHYPHHFRRIFMDSGIERRHFWVPLSKLRQLSWQEQEEQYIKGALSLSKEAMVKCLDGRDPKGISCLVFCSCTGFCPGPTIGHYLIKEFGLPPSTYHTNIGSMGCEGGFPGLRRAYDFTVATGKSSLVVTCELSSCSYFPEPEGKPDPENDYELARANAIFGDAASAALVGFDDDFRHPFIVDTESYFNPEYMDELGYVWRDGRLRVRLSKRIPKIAPLVVKPAIEAVLNRQGLSVSDVKWWVIHAAGNAVLDGIGKTLDLGQERLMLSRETLRRYGNCSSSTVGLTGKLLMSQKINEGDYAVVVSIGPGMVGGATLLWFGDSE